LPRAGKLSEQNMPKPRIAIVFGSDSDWPVMEKCVKQLRAFDEAPFVEVMSAHRNPERVSAFASQAEAEGFEVIIAAAGMSNALAGAVAAHTVLPVIGVPLVSGPLQGFDALLSTIQMPPGIPVAAVSIGDAGAKNAALLAIQIIARHDEKLAAAYRQFKSEQASAVAEKNRKLQSKFTS
jgi:phosphoribosylaminoimidazole carboxylase PurE protein